MEVCIIGAGVIGLSTAVRLQQELPNVRVTIIAEHFSPDTTGDGAAGLWEPYMLGEEQDEELICKWGKETFQHMVKLSQSQEGVDTGSFIVNGYSVYINEPQEPSWKDTVYGFRHLSRTEMKELFPDHRFGYQYTVAVTECKRYLPWLTKRFKQNGGVIIQRKIHTLSQLPSQYNVVVLCCGLGASRMLSDDKLTPVRGQVLRVRAPWVKYFINDDDREVYIIPGSDSVVLGGTHDPGELDLHPSEEQRQRILEGCKKLLPSLESAEVIADWVGLRPTRSAVRLEKQTVDCGCNRQIRVVHNYGHGGAGITLHWGCAGDAVRLVQQHITEITAAKL